MTARARGLVAMLALATLACGRNRATGSEPAGVRPVMVNVRNSFNLSMEVSVAAAGASQRLGLVSAGLERWFVVPPALINNGPMEFYGQPSGQGPVVRSGRLNVAPGDTVDFIITATLFDSRATIRP